MSAIANVVNHTGEVQLWINGKSVIEITGLIVREDKVSHIKGMQFETFFGGRHFYLCPVSCSWFLLFQVTDPTGHHRKTRRLGLRISQEQSSSETNERSAPC
jgi:hypothetical protein